MAINCLFLTFEVPFVIAHHVIFYALAASLISANSRSFSLWPSFISWPVIGSLASSALKFV